MTKIGKTYAVEGEQGRTLKLDTRSTDPVLSRAAITAAVGAVLALLVSFGVDLTEAQQSAVTAVAVVVVPLVAGWWARRKAWAPKTVGEVLDRQLEQVTRP